MSEIWLSAHSDPVANLHTFQSCISLTNVYGQPTHQFVVADNGNLSWPPKLKVPLKRPSQYSFQTFFISNVDCFCSENRIILNISPVLQVYSGTSLNFETNIIETPTAVVSFYVDLTEPRIPALALAAGPYIYVYKNTRPFFKFTLPSLEINQLEQDLWEQAKVREMSEMRKWSQEGIICIKF